MKKVLILCALSLCFAAAMFAKEISTSEGADFSITTRTSFGWDMDHPYRFGLSSDYVTFNLLYHLFPYQALTNKVKSPDAVGFIDLSLFNLDMLLYDIDNNQGPIKPDEGANGAYNKPASLFRDRLQTGSLKAGIAFGDFVLQLKSGGNEPFAEPWNKAFEFVNDKIAANWANLESMVDATRVTPVSQLRPEDPVVAQFMQQDVATGTAIGMDNFQTSATSSGLVALMYNTPAFGFNVKFGTEYNYTSPIITPTNANGLAFGYDMVISPTELAGFKTLLSAVGTVNYGADTDADPVGVGVKVSYDIPVDEATSIEPFIGFDGQVAVPDSSVPSGTLSFGYEGSAGFVYHWPGKGGWYTDYILDKDGRVFPGLSLSYSMFKRIPAAGAPEPDPVHSLKFTLFEERGDEGLFYGLGSEMIVELKNFTSGSSTLMTTAYVDYSVPSFAGGDGTLQPWVLVAYDNLPGTTAGTRDNDMLVNTGIRLINAVLNTTFNFGWYSGNLLTEDKPIVRGILKFSTDIKF